MFSKANHHKTSNETNHFPASLAAMYFLMPLTHNLLLHPQYLGPLWEDSVRDRFIESVEGSCNGK